MPALLLLPVTGDPPPHGRGVLGQALRGAVTDGVALGTSLPSSRSSQGAGMCLHRTTGGGSRVGRWWCGGGDGWGGAGGGRLPRLGVAVLRPCPLVSELSNGGVEELKE